MTPSLRRILQPVPIRLPSSPRATVAVLVALCAASVSATALLALLTGCSASESRYGVGGPLRVLSASPDGATYFSRSPIRIRFSKAVATSGPLADAPVKIEPATPATARFVDEKTLEITPTEPLAPSTRYSVSLVGELGERTDGFHFDFTSVPLEIEGVWGIDVQNIDTTPQLPIHFNQPVSASSVAEHCVFLTADDRNIASKASIVGDAEVGAVVVVSSVSPLAVDTAYRLRCSGLAGARGETPMNGEFELEMRTAVL